VTDVYTQINNVADNNTLSFSCAGTSGTTTVATTNGSRTLTLPNSAGNDTIVGEATTATLTNKTLVSTTNSVRADLLENSSGNSIVITGGSDPSSGDVLVASGALAATWSSGSGLVDLQDAYDNSTDGAIVLDGTRNDLIIRDNATPITGSLFEVQNNGSTAVVAVDVDGLDVTGNVSISGNLDVNGTTTSINTENVLIADNYLTLNGNYVSASYLETGIVAQYQAATGPVTDTIAGDFTATTVITTGSATFSAGDIISIVGSPNEDNNGLFQVLTHVGTTLTINGTPEGFARDNFTADTSTPTGSITKVDVCSLRAKSTGQWEVACGSDATDFSSYAELADETNTLTMTNKVLDSTTNDIRANKLANAAGTAIVVDSTTPSAGQILIATGATAATWQNASALTKSIGYSVVNTRIQINSANLSVGYFTWDDSIFGSYTSPVCTFAISDFDTSNITVQVFNVTEAVTDSSATISANGFYSFAFTKPTVNARLEVRVSHAGAGFEDSILSGVQLEFTQ